MAPFGATYCLVNTHLIKDRNLNLNFPFFLPTKDIFYNSDFNLGSFASLPMLYECDSNQSKVRFTK